MAYYYFVSDSNKILALVTAVCAFMFFKNLRLRYSPIINEIASSVFGVLLIHANSDTMRQWLWKDVLKNIDVYDDGILVIHAFLSVIAIYAICTLIDICRIQLLEKPFFKMYDKIRKNMSK